MKKEYNQPIEEREGWSRGSSPLVDQRVKPIGRWSSSGVDVKSAPHAKHTTSRISWLHTRGPGVENRKRACQFSLKLTKDEIG
jgi:hypothetical protein